MSNLAEDNVVVRNIYYMMAYAFRHAGNGLPVYDPARSKGSLYCETPLDRLRKNLRLYFTHQLCMNALG